MKKDLILAKDYDDHRTAKPKKNKEYYRNLSDKEEDKKPRAEVPVETTENVVLPFGSVNNSK